MVLDSWNHLLSSIFYYDVEAVIGSFSVACLTALIEIWARNSDTLMLIAKVSEKRLHVPSLSIYHFPKYPESNIDYGILYSLLFWSAIEIELFFTFWWTIEYRLNLYILEYRFPTLPVDQSAW